MCSNPLLTDPSCVRSAMLKHLADRLRNLVSLRLGSFGGVVELSRLHRPQRAEPKRRRERFVTHALSAPGSGRYRRGLEHGQSSISRGRPLMRSACRKTEIMTLPWQHVDLDRAETRIVDRKVRSRTVHLSPSAVGVLAAPPREADNPWVVSGAKPGTHMTDIDGAWQSPRASPTSRSAHP